MSGVKQVNERKRCKFVRRRAKELFCLAVAAHDLERIRVDQQQGGRARGKEPFKIGFPLARTLQGCIQAGDGRRKNEFHRQGEHDQHRDAQRSLDQAFRAGHIAGRSLRMRGDRILDRDLRNDHQRGEHTHDRERSLSKSVA